MSRFLAVDNGNSSVKFTLFSEGEIVRKVSFTTVPTRNDLAGYEAEAAYCCSVGGSMPELEKVIAEVVSGPVTMLTHSTPVPMKVKYGTPSTLGLDRLAAAIGAESLFPGEALLIVDAGTAITADVVDGSSSFSGGNISPGLSLRFRSLHEHTDLLPELPPVKNPPYFGTDTESAICAGVQWGVVAEIMATAFRARSLYGVSRILLTGGDANLIADMAKSLEFKFDIVGDLVACGLYRIYLYNENK